MSHTNRRFNLEMFQGETWQIRLQWLEEDQITPIDTTGMTMKMTIKKKASDTPFIHQALSTGASPEIVLVGAPEFFIDITIPADTTEGFTFNTALYDFETIDLSGVVTKLMYGTVQQVLEITDT